MLDVILGLVGWEALWVFLSRVEFFKAIVWLGVALVAFKRAEKIHAAEVSKQFGMLTKAIDNAAEKLGSRMDGFDARLKKIEGATRPKS